MNNLRIEKVREIFRLFQACKHLHAPKYPVNQKSLQNIKCILPSLEIAIFHILKSHDHPVLLCSYIYLCAQAPLTRDPGANI